MSLLSSELILNEDQSIYHLNLQPSDIASIVITVGDPDRVSMVSSYFDKIEIKKQKREFVTHTGYFKDTRITVISTGIGTDNIDIVLNELDALVNIDFETRRPKSTLEKLKIIRIGTSGAIQSDIEVDQIILSKKAIGLDALLHFYDSDGLLDLELSDLFSKHMNWSPKKSVPYAVSASDVLLDTFKSPDILQGISLTNVGFYGPQSRSLRLQPNLEQFHERLQSFSFQENRITNLEMETAGIYGLSKLLGHEALSVNCILANRATGQFSASPERVVRRAIELVLNRLASPHLTD